ncbi:MAG: type II secretion system F family protein [Phototrophicaceae bacterium]
MNNVVIVGIVALVAVVAALAFFMFRRRSKDDLDERLDSIENYDDFSDVMASYEDAQAEADAQTEAQVSVLEQSRSLLEPFNDALSDRQWGKGVRGKLSRANLKMTVAEYAASHVLGAIAGFVLGYVFFASGDVVFSTMFGAVGFFAPRFWVNRRVNKRLIQFEEQLADTLGLWVNALRSGYSVLQAMEAISRDAPEPTKTEFERVVREVQLGIDMEDALQHLLDRIESEDLDLVVTAVNIQREVGGNLAEILEVISHTIRERIKLKGEIRVLTSQGRITGYVISGLPIFLAAFLNFATPGYMGAMFSNRLCGWPLLGIGLALIGIGTAVIQKIIDIEI